MTVPLRIGVIGFGRWAPNLVRNLAKHATIAWVCDPSEAAQERARDAGYVSRDAPEWDACDAVAVVTPIATHTALVAEAMNHGKHVLCEKPLATTRSAAAYIASRAATLMVSSPWLYHPAIIRASAVARELGAPLWFRSTRTSWDERPLDPIADLLPHDVGILQAWAGERVASVSAMHNGHTASITLGTETGVIGTVQYSYRDAVKHRDVALGCELGRVSFDLGTLYVQSHKGGLTADTERRYREPVADGSEPLDAMCAEFVACIREGRQPRHGNIAEAIHVAEVIEAAHTSIREQRVVTL